MTCNLILKTGMNRMICSWIPMNGNCWIRTTGNRMKISRDYMICKYLMSCCLILKASLSGKSLCSCSAGNRSGPDCLICRPNCYGWRCCCYSSACMQFLVCYTSAYNWSCWSSYTGWSCCFS